MFLERFGDPVREIALDHRAGGLDEVDVAVMDLAERVVCFFSKTLDALGVRPDANYRELEPELREALVVGRPIADA